MTDVTPYEPAALTRPDLLDTATDSWVASVSDVVKLAGYICNTDFVPNGFRGSAPATAAAILYGREIGVAPMTALATLHVVHGRVGMSAELMRAAVFAAGHEIEVTESTAAVCRMRGRRRGSDTWTEVAWSMGDARQAGLGGDNWKKYPRAMLVARASAELCRLVFPDVTHGMAATEELDGATPPPTAEVAATPARKVSRAPRTPPPGEGDTAMVPPTPPPVVAPNPPTPPPPPTVDPPPPEARAALPDPPPPVVAPLSTVPPHDDDDPPTSLGIELPPEDLEADPRAQAELRGDAPATPAQVRHVLVLLRRIGLGQARDERLRIAQAITQRPVTTFAHLTITDASRMITTLLLAAESDQPRDYLRWLVDEGLRVMAERDAEAMAEADAEGADPPE